MTDTVAPPTAILNGERLFGFSALAEKLPGYRNNSHVNSSTLFRWATRGVKTAGGAVVRLEAVRLGTAWKSSLEAVARFSAKLTAAALPSDDAPTAPADPTPKARSAAAARASRELDAKLGTR
jgi:hypothetical protein